MRRFPKVSKSEVQSQSKALAQALLLMLLLVRVVRSNAFLNSNVPRTPRVIPGHNHTKRGLPSTWSNNFRILNCQVSSLLHMRQLPLSKYSKPRDRLVVPKEQLAECDRLPRYSISLQYSRTRSKAHVQTQNNEYQHNQTNSFGKYSYSRALASEYGEQWGYWLIWNPVSRNNSSTQSSQTWIQRWLGPKYTQPVREQGLEQ